jgi:ATP adenylyltransferase/5',5'''-P-1,P-4-tetraphosphate phosphorylase II
VSTKYGIVNHDQVIQWSMSISSKKDKKKKKKKKKDEEQDNPADVQNNNVLT